MSGSGQWHDSARGVVYLHAGPAGRVLEAVKINHGRDGWGVRLAEVVGAGGVPFRGFEANDGLMGREAMDDWRQSARRTATPAASNPEADWCRAVTRSGTRCVQTAVRDGLCTVHWRAEAAGAVTPGTV